MSQLKNSYAAAKRARLSKSSRMKGITFNFIRKNRDDPNSAIPVDPSAKDKVTDPLFFFRELPGGKKPADLDEEDLQFIRADETPSSKAKEGFIEMESNYLCYTFNQSDYATETGEGNHMRKYLWADPLGLKDIPVSDSLCWTTQKVMDTRPIGGAAAPAGAASASAAASKASESEADDSDSEPAGKASATAEPATKKARKKAKASKAKAPAKAAAKTSKPKKSKKKDKGKSKEIPVKTTFYTDLQLMQDQFYCYLRASADLYMNKQAAEYFELAMHRMEATEKPPLTRENRCDRDKRIPWSKIKQMILDEICSNTIGSYHFRPLMTSYRPDAQTLLKWGRRVQEIQNGITAYGEGWDSIGTQDATQKYWDWLSKDEKNAIAKFYREGTAKTTWASAKLLIRNEPLGALLNTVTHTMPKGAFKAITFKKKWCQEGLEKLLYTHAFVSDLQATLADAEKEIKRLRQLGGSQGAGEDTSSLSKRQKKRKRQNRKRGGKSNKKKDKDSDSQPEAEFEDADEPSVSFATETKKSTACKPCLAEGLGPIWHKGACNAGLREKTKESFAKKCTDRYWMAYGYKLKKPRQRKYTHHDYNMDHCGWCIAADVAPDYAKNHDPANCFRRKDGPVQVALGVDYKTMLCNSSRKDIQAARKKALRELRERKQKNKGKKGKGGKANARSNQAIEKLAFTLPRTDHRRGLRHLTLTLTELYSIAILSFPDTYSEREVLEDLRTHYYKAPGKVIELRQKVKDLSADERNRIEGLIKDTEWPKLACQVHARPSGSRKRKSTSDLLAGAEAEPVSDEDPDKYLVEHGNAYPTPECYAVDFMSHADHVAYNKRLEEELADQKRYTKLRSEWSKAHAGQTFSVDKLDEAGQALYKKCRAAHVAQRKFDEAVKREKRQRAAHKETAMKSDADTDATRVGEPAQSSVNACMPTCHAPVVHQPCTNAGGSHSPSVGLVDRIRLRLRESPSEHFHLPTEAWIPAVKTAMPVARINSANANSNSIDSNNIKGGPLRTEQQGFRMLQAYMHYRDPKGEIRVGRVQLDTQSQVNFALPGVTLVRDWQPWESKYCLGMKREVVPLKQPTTLTIMREGTPVVIDTNDPHAGRLNSDCIALLGFEAIQKLGIDLNYHARFAAHKEVKYLDSVEHIIERCDDELRETLKEYAAPLTAQDLCRETHLSERVIQGYLDKHPDEYKNEEIRLESMDICPGLSERDRDKILALIYEFRDVFASKTNTLPPAMKDVKPHCFKFKPDAVPKTVPPPKFGPAKAKLILEWLQWAIDNDLVEEAAGSAYSSRLHLAAKYKATTPKSEPPDGIRITWAGVEVNETIEKSVSTYTDAWEQLYKVAHLKYKFSADGLKQYWSIPLDEKSRDATAFWTPKGLFRFKRLVMGTKNAATIAQNAYTNALHNKLAKESQGTIANFADDFLGGGDTPADLIKNFRNFLQMARDAGITINPAKVRVGYTSAIFFGLRVEEGKISHSERNLDPVKNMVYPTNRHELRAVMGVFNQFAHFIDNYGRGPARLLNPLNSPKVPFVLTDKHKEAIDQIKKEILSGVHLYAPDNTIPLHLETDGSEDGWGAVLYQMVDGQRRVIKMWSKKWATEAWQKKPPYHREAKAWMNGMELTLPYAMCNQHAVECYTDHSPLTWVKHTSGKGPVSQFIIDKLSIVDFNMHYIKGKDNIPADAMSRFPMLGPKTPTREGLKEKLDRLLAALTDTSVDATKIWFDARKDTKHLVHEVFTWRDELHSPDRGMKRIHLESLSEANIRKVPYTLGIWAPHADKATQQCLAAYKKGTPFACLVPSQNIRFIPIEKDNTFNKHVASLVEKSGKICFLDTNLTWLIHGAPPVRQIYSQQRCCWCIERQPPVRHVFEVESDRITPEPDLQNLMKTLKDTNLTPPLPLCPNRQEWIRLQREHRIPHIWAGRAERTQDGLWFVKGKDGAMRTIVPRTLQKPLVVWKHYNMCHMGFKKVYHELSKRFYWDNMWSICRDICQECRLCALLKAKMRRAHLHFRAKLFCTPRTAYGSDYYGVKKNKLGYCQILGIIDLSTGNLVLKAGKAASAAHVTHTLFHEIVLRKGVPLVFHTDAARAFLSKAVGALSSVLGIKQTSTLAHNPKSNAKMERVWEFVGRALRAMTVEQYQQFHLMLPILEHVWNNTPDSETGVTPFEAEHGMPMRGVAESLLQDPPAEGLPATNNDLKSIAASAHAYAELLTNIKSVERTKAAMRLNSKGFAKRQFNIGDRVTFYLPPTQKQAETMGKNPKHMLQYAGPGELTKSLSPNGTAWQIWWNGRSYNRNIMHLNPYAPDAQVLHEQRAVQDNTVTVGTYVAVLDNTGDPNYHVAEVVAMTDQLTTLHYLGTSSNRLHSAVWRHMFHKPNNIGYRFSDRDNVALRDRKFTGSVQTLPMGQSLIVLPNLGFNDYMRLTKDTIRILRNLPETHHVYGSTWN